MLIHIDINLSILIPRPWIRHGIPHMVHAYHHTMQQFKYLAQGTQRFLKKEDQLLEFFWAFSCNQLC